MTLHLKSRGYPFRPRVLFSSFIVVGVGFPTVYYFRRGHTRDRFDALVAYQPSRFISMRYGCPKPVLACSSKVAGPPAATVKVFAR